MQRQIRSAFSTLALLTACLAPPALTKSEREALTRAIGYDRIVEFRTDRGQRDSYEGFAFVVLGLDYTWKIVVATLSVPMVRRFETNHVNSVPRPESTEQP